MFGFCPHSIQSVNKKWLQTITVRSIPLKEQKFSVQHTSKKKSLLRYGWFLGYVSSRHSVWFQSMSIQLSGVCLIRSAYSLKKKSLVSLEPPDRHSLILPVTRLSRWQLWLHQSLWVSPKPSFQGIKVRRSCRPADWSSTSNPLELCLRCCLTAKRK
jgi:hypothetical protein